MHINWPEFGRYLYGNRIAIGTFGALLFTSAVRTLPYPGARFDVYAFFYDWAHQMLNITNTRPQQSPPPIVTSPVISQDAVLPPKQ